MKKFLSLFLTLALFASMAAGCAGPATPGRENLTDPLADIIEQIYAQHPVQIAVGTVEVDITDTEWALKGYTGLDSNDLIREATVSEAMIGSIAYSMALVRVNDAKDAQSVAQQMKEGIDPRKWICVEADDLMVAGYGDVVMLVMVSSVYAEDGLTAQAMVDAFQAVCGGELDFTI